MIRKIIILLLFPMAVLGQANGLGIGLPFERGRLNMAVIPPVDDTTVKMISILHVWLSVLSNEDCDWYVADDIIESELIQASPLRYGFADLTVPGEGLFGIRCRVQLNYLWCAGDDISSIDVSKCTDLDSLYAYGNLVTSIDFINNTELRYLVMEGNRMTRHEVTDMIATMPDRTSKAAGSCNIVPMKPTYLQTLTAGQTDSLTAKNWIEW